LCKIVKKTPKSLGETFVDIEVRIGVSNKHVICIEQQLEIQIAAGPTTYFDLQSVKVFAHGGIYEGLEA
jgi:hypothetical protein